MIKKSIIASCIILFSSGCVSINKNFNDDDGILTCSKSKPLYSLEQNLKRFSLEEGFTAVIQNYTNYNPRVYAKNFVELKNELEYSNLDFEIHNYADSMETKRITIFTKNDRYHVDKELLKIEYPSENNKYLTIGEIVKIFNKQNFELVVPTHLYSKVINIIPNNYYKLSDLVNEISNKLIEMNISNSVYTGYEETKKTNLVKINLEPITYKYPNEILNVISKDLANLNIPLKIQNETMIILGNYKQQILSKEIIEKNIKNLSNMYVGCVNEGGKFKEILLQDGIETPINTYESLKFVKINNQNKSLNAVDDYVLLHKFDNKVKEYKIQSNLNKVNISNENINIKLKLY